MEQGKSASCLPEEAVCAEEKIQTPTEDLIGRIKAIKNDLGHVCLSIEMMNVFMLGNAVGKNPCNEQIPDAPKSSIGLVGEGNQLIYECCKMVDFIHSNIQVHTPSFNLE